MLKKLRNRFILFNMAVISAVLIFLMILIFLGSDDAFSFSRLLGSIFIILPTVWLASIIISRIALAPIKKVGKNSWTLLQMLPMSLELRWLLFKRT